MSDHRAPYPPHPDAAKYTKCERCLMNLDWAGALRIPLCDRCKVEVERGRVAIAMREEIFDRAAHLFPAEPGPTQP